MKKIIIIVIVLILIGSFAFGISRVMQNPEGYDTNIRAIMKTCDVSQEQASQIWNILKDCGISQIRTIERDELLDGAYASTDVGFRINGLEPVLYLNGPSGEVHLVRYAGTNLYSK